MTKAVGWCACCIKKLNSTSFTIGADALTTKWDGKDDDERDVPAGKYSARGFLVAPMR